MKKLKIYLFSMVAFSLSSMNSFAGILAESTRVIYPENKREVAMMLNNTNDYPIMTQIWIDQGLGDPDKAQAPFMVLAPIFKMQPHESKGIRILMTPQQNLAKDRETLFWLNLYEVPSVKAKDLTQNHVNMSMNTQMKLIYRPLQLTLPNIQTVEKQLSFQLINQANEIKLQIKNPSPHYISMSQLYLMLNQQPLAPLETDLMIAPYDQQVLSFDKPEAPTQSTKLAYHLIDDQGQHHAFERAVN